MAKSPTPFPARVETVILGATWYGCGLAFSRKPDVLVLERNIVPGWEFALALDPGSDWNAPLATPEAAALRADLIRRNALEGNVVQHAALGPVLAQWCIDRELPICFGCDVVNVSSNAVDFQAVDGMHHVECSKVISAEPVPVNGKKYFSILLFRGDGEFPPFRAEEYPGFRLYPQIVPNRLLWLLELDAAASWTDARKILRDRWSARPESMKEWRLFYTPCEFAYGNDPNPFAALDRGIQEVIR